MPKSTGTIEKGPQNRGVRPEDRTEESLRELAVSQQWSLLGAFVWDETAIYSESEAAQRATEVDAWVKTLDALRPVDTPRALEALGKGE